MSPQRYIDLGLNPEWVRYYLAAKLNARVEDLDFNPDDFLARVNSDLVGKYVNIASRAAGFIGKRFGGALSEEPLSAGRELKHKMRGNLAAPAPDDDQAPAILFEVRSFADAIAADYEAREFSKAIRQMMFLADRVNQYVDEQKPWEIAKESGPGRGAAMVLHALPGALPHPHDLPEARAAEDGRGRRGLPRARQAAHLGGRRHAAQARAQGAAVPAPGLAHRPQADRPAAGAAGGGEAGGARRPPRRRRAGVQARARRAAQAPGDPARGRDDLHRRFRPHRPAHRAHRRRGAGARRRQAAQAHARHRRRDAARYSRASARCTRPRTWSGASR